MSEYTLVEKPFLDQLAALGWQVVDQGQGIPSDPSKSFRANFREILLPEIFANSVRSINTTEDGRLWLTDKQLDELREAILHQPATNLLEANENVLKLLYRAQVDLNELTGEEYPNVKLIDFQHPEHNHFLAINQFRVDTPDSGKKFIIPDIVLFVNGLPLVVIECKDATKIQANPLYEAFRQLMRYANLREDTEHSGLQEGEPRLFYPNQLLIRTSGEHAEFGTITATQEEYFFPWKDIWPETYKNYDPPLGKERQQEILIQGMLAPDTLLDIIRTCTVFMTTESGHTVKVVSRYQQYRAVTKIIAQLRGGQTPAERSGFVWHTQGSGKSLTMVFAIRKLRMCDDLKDLKVCLINDRRDLENQLAETAALTDEKVTTITSTAALKKQLASDASNLNMVMVHKFQEVQNLHLPDYLESVLDHIPEFKNFEVVNPSERIVLMIDEAHRSQSGDMGHNLFGAFPNATRLAFTGTPLIVVKDQKTTIDRFGRYILESRYQRLLQLFTENGVKRIQYFVEQTVSDQAASNLSETSKILEHAVHAMADIRQRANFEVYLKQFMQSLDIILPHAAATPYKIPAKRLGFILDKIKKRYKDDSLNFSGAGEKVKQLIDEHLISLGMDPKIPPVELFSPNFIQELEKNTSAQAKASEMEHAIRKHCTVHFDQDPALYKRLSEKLESVLQRYKDDWEQLCLHLLPFHTDVQGSRQRDIADIFFDHICEIAFGDEHVSDEHRTVKP